MADIDGVMDRSDHEAFRALFRAYYPRVCRYLALRTEPDLVEDLAAQTFLAAWRRQRDLPADPLPWLLGAARKCLANARRGRDRSAALVDRFSAAAAAEPLIEDGVVTAAQRRALAGALAAMTERDRELLVLRYWEDLAPRDVAAVLDLNPALARTRLHRATARLQTALHDALQRESCATGAAALECSTPKGS
jgi:RNA polymerase sigma-70 factor (ECF subfamily)